MVINRIRIRIKMMRIYKTGKSNALLGPLAELSAPVVSSSSSALSHSVFGPIGSDFASRLPLSKSASAANLGKRFMLLLPVLRIRASD
jgi:hypothetical protein